MVGIGTDVDVNEAVGEKPGLVSCRNANDQSGERAYS